MASPFTKRFGFEPVEWHSDISPGQKRKSWRFILQGRVSVVVGARSALFLPFSNLGLILLMKNMNMPTSRRIRLFIKREIWQYFVASSTGCRLFWPVPHHHWKLGERWQDWLRRHAMVILHCLNGFIMHNFRLSPQLIFVKPRQNGTDGSPTFS